MIYHKITTAAANKLTEPCRLLENISILISQRVKQAPRLELMLTNQGQTSGVQFSQGLPLEVINNHGKVLAQRAVSREPGAAVPQSHHISPASHLRAADASTEPPP